MAAWSLPVDRDSLGEINHVSPPSLHLENELPQSFNTSNNSRVLKGGCPRGGGNWGTLRIPREDWGTFGNIRETPPLGPPPLTTL